MSALWNRSLHYWNSKALNHGKTVGLVAAHGFNLFCATHLLFRYVGGPTHVYGPSMLPTMAATGEICIESTLGHTLHGPSTLKRGQLVTFTSPIDPGRAVCKRLAGLPGDIICVDPTGEKAASTEHVVVPRGHIWVAGDNASASRDSRDYGPVHMSLVRGTMWARIWPLSEMKIFENTCNRID